MKEVERKMRKFALIIETDSDKQIEEIKADLLCEISSCSNYFYIHRAELKELKSDDSVEKNE